MAFQTYGLSNSYQLLRLNLKRNGIAYSIGPLLSLMIILSPQKSVSEENGSDYAKSEFAMFAATSFLNSCKTLKKCFSELNRIGLLDEIERQSILEFLAKKNISENSELPLMKYKNGKITWESGSLSLLSPGVFKNKQGWQIKNKNNSRDKMFIEAFELTGKTVGSNWLLLLLEPRAFALVDYEKRFLNWCWNGVVSLVTGAVEGLFTAGSALDGLWESGMMNSYLLYRRIAGVEKVTCYEGKYVLRSRYKKEEWDEFYNLGVRYHKYYAIERKGSAEDIMTGYSETLSGWRYANEFYRTKLKSGVVIPDSELREIYPTGDIPKCDEATTAKYVKNAIIKSAEAKSGTIAHAIKQRGHSGQVIIPQKVNLENTEKTGT